MPIDDSKGAALGELLAELEALRAAEERLRAENEHLLETQRSLEENRNHYSDLFDQAPMPWLTLDELGAIQNLNLMTVTLLGFGRRQLIGAPLVTLVRAEDRRRLLDHLLVCRKASEPMTTELRLTARDREPVLVRLTSRYTLGASEPFTVALEDLKDREAASAERSRLQVAEREARSANEAKDQFIAILSHELRTPLTPVLAAASALADFKELPGEVRDTLAIVQRNVATEAQLIDDLLDLARISHGKLRVDKQPVDAHQAVQNALETLTGETNRKSIEVVCDLTASHHWALGDITRLQQVFWNLLRNAIKFTPDAGRVEVRSWNSGERLLIEVSDSGIGIEPEMLPRLFEPFVQAPDETVAGVRGLGLGLPICRGILEQHDATIAASSRGRGKGARFVIDIASVDRPTIRPPRPSSPPPPSEKTVRILLVEDHEDTADIFERMLRHWGYEVRVATSLQSALAVDREAFDVLLSDVGLTDGSGLDLMRALKKKGHIKGIALSGYGTEEDVRASKEAGFAAHITKPVNFGDLLEAIATLH